MLMSAEFVTANNAISEKTASGSQSAPTRTTSSSGPSDPLRVSSGTRLVAMNATSM